MRDVIQPNQFNVLLTSYEFVMLDKADLTKTQWQYIIVDEGHRIKNKEAKLSKVLRTYKSANRLLLTGTPLQNNLEELWSLLNFLLPDIFNSAENFEQWFNDPFAYANRKGKGQKESALLMVDEEEALLIINRLHKILQPFLLRRLKVEVERELPSKYERILYCRLSAAQERMYNGIVDHNVLLLPDFTGTNTTRDRKGFNNPLVQLQKICNHPYLFLDEWDIDEKLVRVSGKFEVMDRILVKLAAGKHRVLIFSQMVKVMDIMKEYFELRGWPFLRLDGQTKSEQRGQLVEEWNREGSIYNHFILSTHAGGLGLNLQTADTVILFDTDWNPQMDLQAQDRAHRIGTKSAVFVLRLVSINTVEEKILDRANFKLDLDAKVIQVRFSK